MHTASKALTTLGKTACCSHVPSKFLLSVSMTAGSAEASFFVFRNPKYSSRSDPGLLTSWYSTAIQISNLVIYEYERRGEGGSGSFPSSIWIPLDILSVIGDFAGFFHKPRSIFLLT